MKRITFSAFFVLLVLYCMGQADIIYKPYVSSEYSSDKYSITLDTINFLNYKIEVRQLHKEIEDHPDDFYCRGWLTVYQKEKVISKLYFPNIEAVGGCYGFFIPESQPRNDYFIISLYTHYEAFMYVINKSGKIEKLYGGSFYTSNDNKLLFSNDGSDLPWLTVYNLEKKSTVFSDSLGYYLSDWYFNDGEYFATIWDPETDQIDTNQIVIFDTKKKKMKVSSLQNKIIREDQQLKYFDGRLRLGRCNCGQ